MACATIHLAVVKCYLKKHPELDYEKVIAGTLYPDATDDKDQSHYTDSNRGEDNVSHIRSKVNLYSFLEDHQNLNDFEIGWFLHLVTDYLFFEECFSTTYLLENSYEDFCRDLYFAYDHLNLYLSEIYHIEKDDYKAYPSELYPGRPYEDCILPKEMINSFIKRVSNLNLEEYVKKIRENHGNRKP